MSDRTVDTPFALLAEFPNPAVLYTACESVRDEGFTRWDSHTPFPVHGLDRAMGLKASKLPWIVLAMGMAGMAIGVSLQYWVSAVEYPHIISGKPLFSLPAFVPVIFELTILLSSFGAVFGMFHLNRLPTYYNPLFNSERFERVTDDAFFIAIEVADLHYDKATTEALMTLIHGKT